MTRYILFLATMLVGNTAIGDSSIGQWDATKARGETRTVDFPTDEGTWMSMDISPDGRWMVFDLLGHIYRSSAEGGEAECLTQDSGVALNYHPRISPDGTRIAFISDRGGQDNLWVMQSDGSNPEPIFIDEFSRVAGPAWMPDGEGILVTRRFMTGYGYYRVDDSIWLYPLDGGEPREIVGRGDSPPSIERFAGNPRYQWASPSPDGRYVYFNSSDFDGDNRQIKRIELDTGVIQDLTTTEGFGSCCARQATDRLGEFAPEVSPNGRWLAFARKLPGAMLQYRDKQYIGRTVLWLRNLRTGEERILLDPIEADHSDGHPHWEPKVLPGYSWAPDSESIVISQGGHIRRVWVESGEVETIPFTARVHRTISERARGQVTIGESFTARAIRWADVSPDGRLLVFEAIGQLWIKELPGGEPRPLTGAAEGHIERTPSFSPSGDQVVYVAEAQSGNDHVWTVDIHSRERRRLTTRQGTYLYPYFGDHGHLVFVSSIPPALAQPVFEGQWQLVQLPVMGGAIEPIRNLGAHAKTALGPSGRIYFTSSPELGKTALKSMAADGSDVREHVIFAGPALQFSISPDGERVAIVRARNVYVVKLPKGGNGGPQVVDPLAEHNSLAVSRLSVHGGFYPHWRGPDRVAFVIGEQYVTHDLSTNEARQSRIGLQIQRDFGHGTIAFRNARIIALAGGKGDVIPSGDIVVNDGRISCVGECQSENADEVIDSSGMTITPGWIDTHAHHQARDPYGMIPQQRVQSAAYLAYGVTTTLDPAAPDRSFSIGEMTAAGKILGPRSYSTGKALTCDWDPRIFMRGGRAREDSDDLLRINRYEDAQNHVRRHVAMGAISIKDYKQCTRSQRQMLAHAARKLDVSITTENGSLLYILGQLMDGHTGWEHFFQYLPIYGDVAEFIGQTKGHYSADIMLSNFPYGYGIEYWLARENLWENEKARLWTTWQRLAARSISKKRPLSRYMFPIVAEGAWDIAQAGGYPTIGAHGEQHGLGNHWEAWSMAMAAPPLEVLRFATFNGAHFLGLENELGALEVGKLADLVVLNSNPLDNIYNTADIRYVMKSGRLYDAMTLDQIWPQKNAYGPRPWHKEQMLRHDVRSVRP